MVDEYQDTNYIQEQILLKLPLSLPLGASCSRRRFAAWRRGESRSDYRGMNWTETIRRWRRLNVEARQRIRWERIPRQVALSMAFEGGPVEVSWLQKLHHQAELPGTSKQPAGSGATHPT
ncbi:MAG: hypothetical protein DME26_17590 [Verrucomicrobia bacterium]|nr:MAG: hypothetical protein DME26_17590 [Verrucomicrobiota bacterium]